MGCVDAEQMFYLMSRGLDRTSAERMIVEGFFEPVFERLTDKKQIHDIRQALHKKL
jgi:Fe-S cluster assembly protein SufD